MHTVASPPAKANRTPPASVLVSAFAGAIAARSGRRVCRLDPFIARLAQVCEDEAEFNAAREELFRRVGFVLPREMGAVA